MKKALAVSATTLLVGLALAVPASASLPTPDSVRSGHNISVFHNSDFVGVFGYPLGERLRVDVYRGPHRIATAFGDAIQTPEGGGLEINHGPAAAAVQGDCWEGHTPDILPGDKIVVTDSTGTDTILVDDLVIESGPRDVTETADKYDVVLEGHVRRANGTPIPLDQLTVDFRQDVPRYEAVPNRVERAGEDGWIATYDWPYRFTRNEEGLDASEQKQALLSGTHGIGFGHVAPLPPETQIAESGATGGPALDCGNPASPHYAPKQANSIATSDDRAVNIKSGGLTLGGTAMSDITNVSVTLSDKNPATVDPEAATARLSGDSSEKGWSVRFTRAQLETLSDGRLTATGTYSLADGSTMTGAEMTLRKDLLAPKLGATPGPKTANGPLSVALRSNGGERVRYTTDGSLPNSFSRVYRGTPITLTRTATIRASATDPAGNRTDSSFRYVIRQPSTVSLKLSSTGIRLGRSVLISGTLRPAHPQETVTILIKRDGRTVLESRGPLNDSSGYRLRYEPRRVGTFSAQVRFAGDANNLPDSSPLEKFRARR